MDTKPNTLHDKIDHDHFSPNESPNIPTNILHRMMRIVRLLLIGYASEDAQHSFENQKDWEKLHDTLLRKVENIGVVSGLLLASNANLLISSNGDLRRMTYVSVAASILSALISLIFDLLCLWVLIGMHPSRLELLTKRTRWFYYMCGTPSLFGGGSALAFFVAVGSWVWLDTVNQDRNRIGKVCVVVLGGVLTFNTCVCFYLGGSMKGRHWVHRTRGRAPQEVRQAIYGPLGGPTGTQPPISDIIILNNEPEIEAPSRGNGAP